jgi:hypothetical protein
MIAKQIVKLTYYLTARVNLLCLALKTLGFSSDSFNSIFGKSNLAKR